MKIKILYTICLAVLFAQPVFSQKYEGFAGVRNFAGRQETMAAQDTVSPLAARSFGYAIAAGYYDSFMAAGIGMDLLLFQPVHFGARASVDFRDGSIFVAPYIGCTWPFGGFELGTMFRPAGAEWQVPYWESWRIWLGRPDVLYLSAGVLHNVPLIDVGYYDLGVGFAFGEHNHRIWLGVASTARITRAPGGPGVKTEWWIGPNTRLTADGSCLFGAVEDETRWTATIGLKQEF